MKHNFVTKHMRTFNHNCVHKDLKREAKLDSQQSIKEGIEEMLDETYFHAQHISETLIDRYERMCASLLPETAIEPIGPRPGDETNPIHLIWMLNQIADEKLTNNNQAHRWLGFIQCVLVMKGVTTVKEERSFTRPIFKG